MARLRDFYFLIFYSWFRADFFTKTRENRALKAVIGLTFAQVWALLGGYLWGEVLLGFPPTRRWPFLAAVVALYTTNYLLERRGGWIAYEKRFERYSPAKRRWLFAVAGPTNIVAVAVFLSAANAIYAARLP